MNVKRALVAGISLFASASALGAQDFYVNFFDMPPRVEKRMSDGTLLWTTTGGTGTYWLGARAQSNGQLWTTRRMPNIALERFDNTGTLLSESVTPEITTNQGDVDLFADGTLVICNPVGNRIELYAQSGAHTGTISASAVVNPFGCYVDSADRLWVSAVPFHPSGPSTIATFDRAGNLLQTFMTTYCAGDLVVEPAGDVWAIALDGVVHHLTNAGVELSSFATGLPSNCYGIARLADGSLWIASYVGTNIRHFSATGAALGSFVGPSLHAVFLDVDRQCGSASSYCTAGTSSFGCSGHLSATGSASASASTSFTITAHGIDGLKQGLIFYGISGAVATPWGNGATSYSCVKAPWQRTLSTNSGGTYAACNGQFVLDWNNFFAAHPSAIGAPLQTGESFHVQAWWRDPPSVKTASLSDAITFQICP